ncbi:hypothetical protein AB5I41_26770 [Sphingomonas sp. MMS24-JH45]
MALGAAGGAGAVSLTRPAIEMAPTIATPVAKLGASDGIVTVRGRVAAVYGKNFVVEDASGRTLVDAGRGGGGVQAGAPVLVQGRSTRGSCARASSSTSRAARAKSARRRRVPALHLRRRVAPARLRRLRPAPVRPAAAPGRRCSPAAAPGRGCSPAAAARCRCAAAAPRCRRPPPPPANRVGAAAPARGTATLKGRGGLRVAPTLVAPAECGETGAIAPHDRRHAGADDAFRRRPRPSAGVRDRQGRGAGGAGARVRRRAVPRVRIGRSSGRPRRRHRRYCKIARPPVALVAYLGGRGRRSRCGVATDRGGFGLVGALCLPDRRLGGDLASAASSCPRSPSSSAQCCCRR